MSLLKVNLKISIGRRSYLSEAKVKYYIYELIKALDHMHSVGIFHRDIKPYLALLSLEKMFSSLITW